VIFEELVLRPASGAVDVDSVRAWLDSRPFAFRDPVADAGWHLSASPALMALNRRARLERPREFPCGLRVTVAPDQVWVAARADRHDLARGLQLVQWLVGDRAWTVAIDGGRFAPVGDPARLFPSDLPDPATLIDGQPWNEPPGPG
jgi:hypothetical protein